MAQFVEDAEWDRLIDQLSRGDCTPFLGAGACHGTLPTSAELSRKWAAANNYPFPDDTDLARVMQHAATTYRESVYVKQLVCAELAAHGPPDFTRSGEVHALLADFPIPVYLTTNYDNFLAQALDRAGRTPRTAVCQWHDGLVYDEGLFDSPSGINPQAADPLVYHLHGHLRTPESLVLTEDDYLEFLIGITSTRDENRLRLIPSAILRALTTRPLLFIGYSLQDWTFRVLFHGLMRTIPAISRRRHVSVQLLPPVNSSIARAEELAYQHLTNYLENWKISVFWGTSEEFCTELRRRAGAAA